jgi:hypothetical protein
VAVVGAGLAGLVAATTLQAAGHEVVVFDKGRSPGGRLATRRIGGATLDHGAQFFTVRSEPFAAQVDGWRREGLVEEWCRGFEPPGDGHPRYRVAGGMNALPKWLARGLDVRCGHLVFAVRPGTRRAWSVALDDGTDSDADAVVVTAPVPQSFSLLVTAGVEMPAELLGTEYDRTLALLAVLDGPSSVPGPGGVQQPDEAVSFVADNWAKGVSAVPALTLHASPSWSEAHWDDDRDALAAALERHAAPWLGGSRIVESQVKRWRFATPRRTWPDPCWRAADDRGALVLAGDAFAGPRMEGAACSGLAAAAAVLA